MGYLNFWEYDPSIGLFGFSPSDALKFVYEITDIFQEKQIEVWLIVFTISSKAINLRVDRKIAFQNKKPMCGLSSVNLINSNQPQVDRKIAFQNKKPDVRPSILQPHLKQPTQVDCKIAFQNKKPDVLPTWLIRRLHRGSNGFN